MPSEQGGALDRRRFLPAKQAQKPHPILYCFYYSKKQITKHALFQSCFCHNLPKYFQDEGYGGRIAMMERLPQLFFHSSCDKALLSDAQFLLAAWPPVIPRQASEQSASP